MRWGLALVLIVIAAVVIATRCRSDQSTHVVPVAGTKSGSARRAAPVVRGAITGVIIDEARAPIAGAFVCAQAEDEPTCVRSDANGAFRFELAAGRYSVSASAATFRPQSKPAQLGANVELVLRHGGVEVKGTVSDVSGGPIANARVFDKLAATETRMDGSFSLWVDPGDTRISASAEGYAANAGAVYAPGTIALFLVPEGTVSGVVIDASTNEPVAGATVYGHGSVNESEQSTTTNADGSFRLARLKATRYSVTAMTAHGYGHSDGSVLVTIGSQVEGVVVKLFPAARVEAKVVVATTKAPCEEPSATLFERNKARTRAMHDQGNGTLVAEGVLPGNYEIDITCGGFVDRDEYPHIVVGSDDVAHTFEVEPGAKIEGTARDSTGDPVSGVSISATPLVEDVIPKWRYRAARTDHEGHYTLAGVPRGTVTLRARAGEIDDEDHNEEIKITTGTEAIRRDIVIKERSKLTGTLVDMRGNAIANGYVVLKPSDDEYEIHSIAATSDASGRFTIERAPPGNYVLEARRSWRHKFKVEKRQVKLVSRQTTTLTITLDEPLGSITGTVTELGQPVTDAFVEVLESSNAIDRNDWYQPSHPIVTGSDGTFTVDDLPRGTYKVRAFRRGGGDGVVENVALGDRVRIAIVPTGSIAGTVRSWSATLDDLTVTARDQTTSTGRGDSFLRTNGAFEIKNLPPGRYTLTAGAEGQEASTTIDLAANERKTNVVLELVPHVSITGRVVSHLTKQPITKPVYLFAHLLNGNTQFAFPDRRTQTDPTGRFTIRGVPLGIVALGLTPTEPDHLQTHQTLRVAGRGTVDVGDIAVMAAPTSTDGYSGLVVDISNLPTTEKWEIKVTSVMPNSPAAVANIREGDVITSIDGVSVAGWSAQNVYPLISAAPGTKLSIVLARGITVDVVLAKQP